MVDETDYTVTKLAGPKVAGRTVSPGDKIALTEVQARAELLAGAIVADPTRVEDPFKAPSTPATDAPAAGRPAAPLPPAAKPADGAGAGAGAPG